MSGEHLSMKEPRKRPIQRGVAEGAWLFLNFTKPNEHKDANTKKIIRSNAMMHFRQQKRVTRSAAPIAISSKKCLHSREKTAQICNTSSRICWDGYDDKVCPDDEAMILEKSLRISTVDPPAGLPIVIPTYASKFIHHFQQFMSPNIREEKTENSTNAMRSVLVPAALSQLMYFEAVMFMVSTHLDVLRDTESSRTTLFHRGRSLKLINEYLQPENSRPSDLLIVTAVGLLSYDNVNGQLVEAAVHMAGVRKMVLIRGGLQHLGMNGVLAKMILLIDIMGAGLGTSKPIFKLSELQLNNPIQDSLGILPIRKATYIQDSRSLGSFDVDEGTVSLLSTIREVNMLLFTIQGGKWTEESIAIFVDAKCRLRRKLSSLLLESTSQDRAHPSFYRYECCRLAAQIYEESIFSPLSFLNPINDCYVKELKIALQVANHISDWSPIPEALVWVCLVGGAAAIGRPERKWMIVHLGPPMMALGMLHFEELMNSMLLFVGLSKLCKN